MKPALRETAKQLSTTRVQRESSYSEVLRKKNNKKIERGKEAFGEGLDEKTRISKPTKSLPAILALFLSWKRDVFSVNRE